MGRLFALADLHLSLAGQKPMDIFGKIWRNHAVRMAENWDSAVDAGDTVLLPGDLSWGHDLVDAAPDLAWIGARPGHKILLRGNHDSWWGSLAKVRAALPADCQLLQNNALLVDGRVIVGARGWTAPDDPVAGPSDGKVFERELDRLRLSLAVAEREFPRELPRVAILHYPPWIDGREPTAVVPLLEEAGVRACIYGHLHGGDHRLAVTGRHRGIDFYLAAADAVDFRPIPIDLPGVAL